MPSCYYITLGTSQNSPNIKCQSHAYLVKTLGIRAPLSIPCITVFWCYGVQLNCADLSEALLDLALVKMQTFNRLMLFDLNTGRVYGPSPSHVMIDHVIQACFVSDWKASLMVTVSRARQGYVQGSYFNDRQTA